MRRGRGEWAKLSALASLVAVVALAVLVVVARLVHGMTWQDAIEDPAALQQPVILGMAAVCLATPGLVVGGKAGARGRRLAVVALSSLLVAVGVGLLSVGAPVAIWAGMVAGTLLAVVATPMAGSFAATSVPGEWEPETETGSGPPGVVVGDPTVVLERPQRRLVPRDVMAPPEGWEVPDALPRRLSSCAPEARSDQPGGRSNPGRRAHPHGQPGEQVSH